MDFISLSTIGLAVLFKTDDKILLSKNGGFGL